jgi:hypothetical protein
MQFWCATSSNRTRPREGASITELADAGKTGRAACWITCVLALPGSHRSDSNCATRCCFAALRFTKPKVHSMLSRG